MKLEQLEVDKRIVRFKILHRAMSISLIVAALFGSGLVILIAASDPGRVEVVFRVSRELTMTLISLWSTIIFGGGLWFWLSESRVLRQYQ